MCGLAGLIHRGSGDRVELRAQVERMADRLIHRGPDDSGTWVDARAGVALGFRRLSILDLSEAGHQPMVSACGRYVIVFNGEVYNANSLRSELEQVGHHFRGHSDTEVILAAVGEWGLRTALRRFVGMFAIALWDRAEFTLCLVRDRLGIKPLYYGEANGAFLFGSELKALRAHPTFDNAIDRGALALQLRYGYIPQPFSIYKAYKKLAPGTILTLDASTARQIPHFETYWTAREITERGAEDYFTGSEEEAIEQLDVLLRESVRLRMVADVNVGAFLSGGIDSSLIVALIQAQSRHPIKTFSIGFSESGYDEAASAKKVASYFGTDHTELYVTPDEALAVIPNLPNLNDEPFSDSSQIPTYLVSALTRRQVTVSLSGDGGDELFGGYNEYLLARRLNKLVGWIPLPARRMISALIAAVRPEIYSRLLKGMELPFARYGRIGPAGDKLHKLSQLLAFQDSERLHCALMSHWRSEKLPLLESLEPLTVLTDPAQWARADCVLQRATYLDLVTYLPDDILAKVDRASMAVGLEVRVPLLDHRVVEFAARIPTSMKIRHGRGKWLLRQLLSRYLPTTMIQHSKRGFGVPIATWLRGPLREWSGDLLNRDRLAREGFFEPDVITRLWTEHMSGQRNWHSCLWDVLMFQAWNGSQHQGSVEHQFASPYAN